MIKSKLGTMRKISIHKKKYLFKYIIFTDILNFIFLYV